MIISRTHASTGSVPIMDRAEAAVGIQDVAQACSGEREVLDAIEERLQDPDPSVRREVLMYCLNSDLVDAATVGRMVHDDDHDTRCLAAFFYLRLDGRDTGVLSAIAAMGDSPVSQSAAAQLLGI